MSYAPKSISNAMAVWTSNGGVNLGVVGNTGHTVGYHLGKDRIYDGSGPGIGDSDYSIKLARDKAGLTNAAAAADLGRLNGSLGQLQSFSKWLVGRCKANAPGTSDIREVIYSPDGTAVKRWDNNAKVLYTGGDGTGQGDNSHRTHTHISFFRDSEARDKTIIFSPYFTPAPPEVPMSFNQANIPKGTWIYVNGDFSTNAGNVQIDPGRPMLVEKLNAVSGGHLIVHDTSGKHYYVKAAQVTVVGLVPVGSTNPVPVPPDATSCKPFSDAAYAAGKTDGFAEGKAAGQAVGVEEEQARIRTVLGI